MRKNRKKILLGFGGVLLSGLLLNQHILTVQAESVKPFKAKQQVQAKFTTNQYRRWYDGFVEKLFF